MAKTTVKRNRIRLAKQEGCTWLQHNLLYISFQSSADYDVNSRGPLVALSQGTCLFGFYFRKKMATKEEWSYSRKHLSFFSSLIACVAGGISKRVLQSFWRRSRVNLIWKWLGCLSGNFELNPERRPIWAWPNLFWPLKETILNFDYMNGVNKMNWKFAWSPKRDLYS